ncbi:MAG: DsrE family protein [Gemmatimonadota bacterium]|jgi:intracellular sulfur oxidation DsrE/DsrF family protein|nr:DsrE family protein [Gemmatimonadota bacterium]
MRRVLPVLFAFLAVAPAALVAQTDAIPGVAAMREVPRTTFVPDPKATYRYFWNHTDSAATGEVNPGFLAVASTYNALRADGVPAKQIKLALVLHGRATVDLMANAPYRARMGRDNPNIAILEQLSKAGVDIIVCGQALFNRNVPRDDLLPFVQVARSAGYAHMILAAKGYGTTP